MELYARLGLPSHHEARQKGEAKAWVRAAGEILEERGQDRVEEDDTRIERSPDGRVVRIEAEGATSLQFAVHHHAKRSSLNYRMRMGNGGVSGSGAADRPERSLWDRLTGQKALGGFSRVACERLPLNVRLPMELDSHDQAMQLVHQAWTAWNRHGRGAIELHDGQVTMQATGTPDGRSFQAEMRVPGERDSRVITLDLFDSNANVSYALGNGTKSVSAGIDCTPQPPSPHPELYLRLLVRELTLGSRSDPGATATHLLNAFQANPEHDLEEQVGAYERVAERCPQALTAFDQVLGLAAKADLSTALEVFEANAKDFRALAKALTSEADCREYLRNPLEWEARRLGDSVRGQGEGVRETASDVQVGLVRLRKR